MIAPYRDKKLSVSLCVFVRRFIAGGAVDPILMVQRELP
jgi:hypothetical protein